MKSVFCLLALSLPLVYLAPTSGLAQDAPAKADADASARLDALEASARRFVEAYNQGNAESVAATFVPEAELTLKDGTVIAGREAITEFYREAFAGVGEADRLQASIEVGSVHFVTPGVAVENGTLHLTAPDGGVSSQSYTAIQIQQADGTWLTGSVRDESDGEAAPVERLAALSWMVGDWLIQNNGIETRLSFDWSDFGPYLEGSADMVETLEGNRVGIQIRIGWDADRGGFTSWNHDSAGGFVQSEWTETGDGNWLIRSKGTTADGEANIYTQVCTVDENRERFTWEIRDQTIGGEAQPDRVLEAVKLPPAANLSQSNEPQ
jgi:uncharacterized protein (TIGR02246 family)